MVLNMISRSIGPVKRVTRRSLSGKSQANESGKSDYFIYVGAAFFSVGLVGWSWEERQSRIGRAEVIDRINAADRDYEGNKGEGEQLTSLKDPEKLAKISALVKAEHGKKAK